LVPDLRLRVFDVLGEHRVIPGDAGVLVGLGIVVARDAAGLAAEQAVQFRADAVLRRFADLMAGTALVEGLFARGNVLSVGGADKADGGKSETAASERAIMVFDLWRAGKLACG
jgi:hypothetical protein